MASSSKSGARSRQLRALKKTIQDIHARNTGTNPDEIQRIVDEAVSEVRKATPAKRRSRTRPRRH